ncbi:MAG: tRNA adenosine(34) deaminase TadA [Clostridia bacterium]|nr:tRNA adenosine(34) deaminase TadA [Clostridia bacterium]
MDEKYMLEALELAKTAASLGEVPVGAVVVRDGEIIGKGYNLRENKKSASAHAEIIAIEQACNALGSWRLSGCTLYVTMEPCPMCAGAIVNSRIDRVVYGCKDVVAGCCGSVINFNAYPFNHSFTIESGVCETQATELLKGFFAEKRKRENK